MTARKLWWDCLYEQFVSTVMSDKLNGANHVRAAVERAQARRRSLKDMHLVGQMAFEEAYFIPCTKSVMLMLH